MRWPVKEYLEDLDLSGPNMDNNFTSIFILGRAYTNKLLSFPSSQIFLYVISTLGDIFS